jgi:hypothetical protein
MRFRKLRIAWSVAWGFAAVLLIVLWVRSYQDQEMDWAYWKCGYQHYVDARSDEGRVSIAFGFDGPRSTLRLFQSTRSFDYVHDPIERYRGILFPHWLSFAVATGFAVVPWIRWRFSLRTLLIATTLVAVALGFAVYALRT